MLNADTVSDNLNTSVSHSSLIKFILICDYSSTALLRTLICPPPTFSTGAYPLVIDSTNGALNTESNVSRTLYTNVNPFLLVGLLVSGLYSCPPNIVSCGNALPAPFHHYRSGRAQTLRLWRL